ncbi:MAG: AEC family transporter [Clostridia bacterium]|nr:AEC family transporter [Clostridia bacterium]
MNVSFFDVLITVIFLILLALPGFIFAKLKMLPEKASEAFSVLVLYGCQPVLIITSFQSKEYIPEIGLNMLYVMLLAVAVHLTVFAVLKLLFIKRSADDKIKIVKYAGAFSNCGFMGFPFLQSLFTGETLAEVMLYGAVVVAVFNVLTWTFGVYIMTGDLNNVSVKKIALNPVIISVVIGFLLFVLVKKPIVSLAAEGTAAYSVLSKLMQSLNFIADMVTPLSMTVIGIKLANVGLKQLFFDGQAYLAAALKLLLMPALTMLITVFLPISAAIKYTLFFLLAMPSATSTAMFAVKFGKDGDFASVCVLLSTLLSVLTIPPLYLFMSGVLGVTI